MNWIKRDTRKVNIKQQNVMISCYHYHSALDKTPKRVSVKVQKMCGYLRQISSNGLKRYKCIQIFQQCPKFMDSGPELFM